MTTHGCHQAVERPGAQRWGRETVRDTAREDEIRVRQIHPREFGLYAVGLKESLKELKDYC